AHPPQALELALQQHTRQRDQRSSTQRQQTITALRSHNLRRLYLQHNPSHSQSPVVAPPPASQSHAMRPQQAEPHPTRSPGLHRVEAPQLEPERASQPLTPQKEPSSSTRR